MAHCSRSGVTICKGLRRRARRRMLSTGAPESLGSRDRAGTESSSNTIFKMQHDLNPNLHVAYFMPDRLSLAPMRRVTSSQLVRYATVTGTWAGRPFGPARPAGVLATFLGDYRNQKLINNSFSNEPHSLATYLVMATLVEAVEGFVQGQWLAAIGRHDILCLGGAQCGGRYGTLRGREGK